MVLKMVTEFLVHPKINATMAMNWETPVEGLSLNARALYFGKSYADSKNNIKVPSWDKN